MSDPVAPHEAQPPEAPVPDDVARHGTVPPVGHDTRARPMVERLGMAAIALVMAALFAVVAVTAFIGGEPFLGVMGAVGCLMVLWVGGLTLFRG